MERKLKRLFDYQKFQRNVRLGAMVAEVESRYENGISDEDLAFVSAAGEITVRKEDAPGFFSVASLPGVWAATSILSPQPEQACQCSFLSLLQEVL